MTLAPFNRDIYLLSSSAAFFRYSVDRDALEFGLLTAKGWRSCTAPKAKFRPALGQWAHIAGTYDGSVLRLWLDGRQVAETPADGSIELNALVLGGVAWDSSSISVDFQGWLDELRISRIPRTEY